MAPSETMGKVIYSPEYRSYDFGPQHPFSPTRVDMMLDLMKELGTDLSFVDPEPARDEDLLSVHDEAYLSLVDAVSRGMETPEASRYGLATPDNPAFDGMDAAARWHVGGTLTGAKLIDSGDAAKVLQLGGGLHHAQRSKASGFCIYNDIAVAIRHLTAAGHWVAYLDIDVHHGDGVQQIFYEDEHVLTLSLHESGRFLFPGTGEMRELGNGMGRGLKLNVPLEPFTDGPSYLEVFDKVVPRALEWFSPDVLVVQAGADGHFEDPLADLMLTTRTYEGLYHRILDLAERFTEGRLLITLGGGYSLVSVPRVWAVLCHVFLGLSPIPANLPDAWLARWAERLGDDPPRTLHDGDPAFEPVPASAQASQRNRHLAERFLDIMSPFWF